jgi:SAM-dependent methyltransferase
MKSSDDGNLIFAESSEAVDALNSKFYGRFQYPWAPMAFDSLTDPQFETVMLNQTIGSWRKPFVIPQYPKIWVAGCGTNQAVFTALRFPKAVVLGSDLSITSLETSARTAKQLGISNLELRQESINQTNYREEFDYVISTGVIHHNAEPKTALAALAAAVKPTGILELMVYNRYHRVNTTAFQKAVRILCGSTLGPDFESELRLARKTINGLKSQNSMAQFLGRYKETTEAELADALLQPVEHSFTVESLEALADGCGLETVAPCINQYDKANQTFSWNLEFADADLQNLYDSLPDSQRRQVSNHLLLEKSPMLWFYFQRSGQGRAVKSELQLCEEFLAQRFVKSSTTKRVFLKKENGDYVQGQRLLPYPGLPADALCSKIIAQVAAQPSATMRAVFEQLEIETGFTAVNKLRLSLTTNAFPFLKTV